MEDRAAPRRAQSAYREGFPLLHYKNVSFTYPDQTKKSISGISLNLREGEKLGVIGANGAGKSTLLFLPVGILYPTEGEIEAFGTKLSKKTAAEIRREVGLVFQESDEQLFSPTVYEDVAFGPRKMGLSEDEVSVRTADALETTGISHLGDRPPYSLSGGEKKLAAIAAVLSMRPKLLLLDEPSSALDPRARRNVINLIRSLPASQIIASHDLDLIWDVCDRVIVLQKGEIAADGTRELLRGESLLAACGLELPLKFQREG